MKKILSMLMVISILMTISITGASALNLDNIQISEDAGVLEDFINDEENTGFVFGYIGDPNQDEEINVKDATAIQKHVADLEHLTTAGTLVGDVDNDGKLTVKDATAIQKYIAQIPVDMLFNHVMYLRATIDEALAGKWEVTTDVAEVINSVWAEIIDDPLFIENVNISKFEIKYVYEFFPNGMYTVTPDEAVMKESIAELKEEFKNDVTKYLEAVSDEYGLGLSAEELLNQMGYTSLDDFINEVSPEEVFEDMLAPTTSSYFAADGELFYSGSGMLDYYEYYTIDGDTLTLTGNNLNEFPEGYPIVMTRIG